jgi:hypothetical protein
MTEALLYQGLDENARTSWRSDTDYDRIDRTQLSMVCQFVGFVPPDPGSHLDSNHLNKKAYLKNNVRVETKRRPLLNALEDLYALASRGTPRAGDVSAGIAVASPPRDSDEPAAPQASADVSRLVDAVFAALDRPDFLVQAPDVIELVRSARARGAGGPVADRLLLLVVVQVLFRGGTVTSQLGQEAMVAGNEALHLDGHDVETMADQLVVALAMKDETTATDLIKRAAGEFGTIPSGLLLAQAKGYWIRGDAEMALQALEQAIAVEQSLPLAERESAEVAVNVAAALLPLANTDEVALYRKVVALAVRAAAGSASGEDAVRPHRLWAGQAGRPMFTGSLAARSMVGVLTGFLVLPVFNQMRSKPAWRVLVEGEPSGAAGWQAVRDASYVRAIHPALLFAPAAS